MARRYSPVATRAWPVAIRCHAKINKARRPECSCSEPGAAHPKRDLSESGQHVTVGGDARTARQVPDHRAGCQPRVRLDADVPSLCVKEASSEISAEQEPTRRC